MTGVSDREAVGRRFLPKSSSRPARISEDDLLARSDDPVTVMPCSCGGQVAAVFGNWDDIGEAVLRHAESERHAAWRLVMDIE